MFSGTSDESKFRIVDYLFRHHADSGELLSVEAGEPMAICPEVQNDLNTPFISKDGRYVAAYTSPVAGNAYASGASLKVYEITSTDPANHTTSCRSVADVGFAAGKADFSFDNSMLTFHSSQGAYLTPFVNGGLPTGTITDIFVARLVPAEMRDSVARLNDLRQQHNRIRAQVPWLKAEWVLLLMGFLLFTVLGATWVGLYISRGITVPIQRLAEGTLEIRRGHLEHQVQWKGVDELVGLRQHILEQALALALFSEAGRLDGCVHQPREIVQLVRLHLILQRLQMMNRG